MQAVLQAGISYALHSVEVICMSERRLRSPGSLSTGGIKVTIEFSIKVDVLDWSTCLLRLSIKNFEWQTNIWLDRHLNAFVLEVILAVKWTMENLEKNKLLLVNGVAIELWSEKHFLLQDAQVLSAHIHPILISFTSNFHMAPNSP